MPVINATATWGKRADRLLTQIEQDALVAFVGANPEIGDIVAGTGGVRKLRWGMAGQGKRGGVRVLHLFLRHKDTLWLLDIYAKREKSDLGTADIKNLRALVETIKRGAL
jgi:hypothetical protein